MKISRILSCAAVAVLLLGAVACKKTKEEVKPSEGQLFVKSLTEKDTMEALTISQNFMESLKAGDLDKAFSLLVLVDTARNVKPLPEETIASLKETYTRVPVKSFEMVTFQFMKPDSNFVRYKYSFVEVPEGEKGPTMALSTMPMKIDGKWVLTMPGYVNTGKEVTKTGINNVPADTASVE